MDKTKNNSHAFKTNMRAWKHIHSLHPAVLPLMVFRAAFAALSPYINLYMSAEIMNELAGGRDINRLILLVIITVGANLTVAVLSNLFTKLHTDAVNLYRENALLYITGKTLTLDYGTLENPDTQQLRREILNAAGMSSGSDFGGYSFGMERPIDFMGQFTSNIVNLILSSLLFSQLIVKIVRNGTQPVYLIFGAVIIACMAVNIFYKLYVDKLQSNQQMDFNKLHSQGQRISAGLSSYNMGKDIRLYRLDKLILKIKWNYMQHTIKANKEMEMFSLKTGIPESIISRVMQVCAYIFVCVLAVDRVIQIGDIIKYVGALSRFLGGISGLFYPIGQLKYNTQFLDKHFEFLDIPSETAKSGNEKVDLSGGYEIEFKNVSFKYPASENYVFKNVCLSIKSGESLAVVGMNGSGKTTFIKLLCRLYEIDEGEILLNGRNIKEYDYYEYMNIFSILFQDFKLFSFSLGENISLRSTYEKELAEQCIEKVGFGERYGALEKGLETYIYKNFDEGGIEVSGGEAQKIALARVLYQDSPFIILDEPTSALDPISEYEIYSKFNEMAKGRTAVFISHRLSSCRFCENIAVFHGGELVQYSSHDKLIADEGGKYHELWNAQAQYYSVTSEEGCN